MQERVLVSRHVRRVWWSSIAMLSAKGIIGRRTKNNANYVLELRDEALFKDPPPQEDCAICFIPMPFKLIYCVSLPPIVRADL